MSACCMAHRPCMPHFHSTQLFFLRCSPGRKKRLTGAYGGACGDLDQIGDLRRQRKNGTTPAGDQTQAAACAGQPTNPPTDRQTTVREDPDGSVIQYNLGGGAREREREQRERQLHGSCCNRGREGGRASMDGWMDGWMRTNKHTIKHSQP